MIKPLRILVFVGGLALVAVVLGTLGAHSGSRSALRVYVAELQAKGEKLIYADLTRDRATNFFDSQAVISNAAAQLRSGRISPSLLETRRYLGQGQAIVTWQQPRPLWGSYNGSPRANTWEDLEAQMQDVRDALQEVRAALKTPAPDAGPCTNMFLGSRINFVGVRVAAQWLAAAVINDLHQGRLESALQNTEALAGLANMERDEPTLVAQMIRVAVSGLALSATWEALQAPGWTEPQLERLQKAWAPVDLVDAVERGFEGARASAYALFVETRRTNSAQIGRLLRGNWYGGSSSSPLRFENVLMDYVGIPVYKLTSIDQDELFYLQSMQEGITGLRMLKSRHPWGDARQRLNQVTTNVAALHKSPQRIRYYYSLMAIPNYTKACETAVHAEVERQMTLAAIALKRYELRHGQLPPSLEALVPEFLAAVPWDYMAARPLCYSLNAGGTYLLYSVGEDGKDDGGDPTPSGAPGGGIWAGRDAVWPWPAKGAAMTHDE